MSRLNPNHPYFFTGPRVQDATRWTWVAGKDLHAVEIDGGDLATNNELEMHQKYTRVGSRTIDLLQALMFANYQAGSNLVKPANTVISALGDIWMMREAKKHLSYCKEEHGQLQ